MPGALRIMSARHLRDEEMVGLVLHFERGADYELDLPDDAIAEMLEHIEVCPSCQAERDRLLQGLRRLRAAAKSVVDHPLDKGRSGRNLRSQTARKPNPTQD